jgi:hypothetical protein
LACSMSSSLVGACQIPSSISRAAARRRPQT